MERLALSELWEPSFLRFPVHLFAPVTFDLYHGARPFCQDAVQLLPTSFAYDEAVVLLDHESRLLSIYSIRHPCLHVNGSETWVKECLGSTASTPWQLSFHRLSKCR
jgi:hypothetical protein